MNDLLRQWPLELDGRKWGGLDQNTLCAYINIKWNNFKGNIKIIYLVKYKEVF